MDFVRENIREIVACAVIAVVLWYLLRAVMKRGSNPAMVPVAVYCRQCNWEGTVPRSRMICRKCKSTNVQASQRVMR